MNIIFLDIDGVLNSQAYLESKRNNKGFYELSTFHLQKLAKLYHSCNALIVLTSTWRQLEKEDIYQYLIDSLAKYDMYIISKTPIINMNRPLEIKTWLNNRIDKEQIHFIILDDDFSQEEYDKYDLGKYLIKTYFYCDTIEDGGLQQKQVDDAINLFKKQERNDDNGSISL